MYYRLAGSDGAALWAELRDVASTRLANVDRVRGAYLGKGRLCLPLSGLVGRQWQTSVGVATAHDG